MFLCNYFDTGYFLNSGEVINKLKLRGFRATSLSTCEFSRLYTTLPHNLIKEKLKDSIEWSFQKVLHTLPVTKETGSLLLNTKLDIIFDRVVGWLFCV